MMGVRFQMEKGVTLQMESKGVQPIMNIGEL